MYLGRIKPWISSYFWLSSLFRCGRSPRTVWWPPCQSLWWCWRATPNGWASSPGTRRPATFCSVLVSDGTLALHPVKRSFASTYLLCVIKSSPFIVQRQSRSSTKQVTVCDYRNVMCWNMYVNINMIITADSTVRAMLIEIKKIIINEALTLVI